MRILYACLIATSLVGAACSGDDGGSPLVDAGIDSPNPDAPPGGACGTIATTLSTYPANYAGSTATSGADFTVAEGACTDEVSYYEPAGNDAVVDLENLTAGHSYVVTLTATTDMSLYVATACGATGPSAGACMAFRDQTTTGEELTFVAPASGKVSVVVDAETTGAAGDFTLDVKEAECVDNMDCATPGEPICLANACVQCADSFDCTTAGAPVCDATNTCVAGPGTCTGDTTGENDNGPAAARMIAFPTATTPTSSGASLCGTDQGDDWYKFTAPAAGALRVVIGWTVTADLDFTVYDATGAVVVDSASGVAQSETRLATLAAAGTYYLQVTQYVGSGTPTNDPVAYTVQLGIPECTTSFQCLTAGAPVCDNTGTCVAGPDMCTGDVSEPDDGPAAARDLTGAVGTAVTLPGAVCNTPAAEADWYKVTVAAGQGLTLNTSFTAPTDIDVSVFDSAGRLEGLSFWNNPEAITLTYLPAGTHYVRVVVFASPAVTAAATYSITATRTAAQTCASRTDCASTYTTQIYRGACTAGACQFIPAGTAAEGQPCDSPDDCAGRACSYFAFERDADKSVCNKACTTTADCASLGAGYTCTTGFQVNECVPSCAADLDCGANTNATPTAGSTWSYFACTSGTCNAPM